MIEATSESFQRDVLDASCEKPVLVDFWAPWCGPCRALGPLLERLERDYNGRFRLVKINSDANPELSAQYKVRSIPYVLAFVDGAPTDSFVGALPESHLRIFLERVLPNPSEIARRKAAQLSAEGNFDAAASSLRAALALDPANDAARLDLVRLLLHKSVWTEAPAERGVEAFETLADCRAETRQGGLWNALNAQVDNLLVATTLPPVGELQARIAKAPDDLQARFDLAKRLAAESNFEPALDQLLEITRRDRSFGGDVGRKQMLALFELLQDRPELVASYRRLLSATLNR